MKNKIIILILLSARPLFAADSEACFEQLMNRISNSSKSRHAFQLQKENEIILVQGVRRLKETVVELSSKISNSSLLKDENTAIQSELDSLRELFLNQQETIAKSERELSSTKFEIESTTAQLLQMKNAYEEMQLKYSKVVMEKTQFEGSLRALESQKQTTEAENSVIRQELINTAIATPLHSSLADIFMSRDADKLSIRSGLTSRTQKTNVGKIAPFVRYPDVLFDLTNRNYLKLSELRGLENISSIKFKKQGREIGLASNDFAVLVTPPSAVPPVLGLGLFHGSESHFFSKAKDGKYLGKENLDKFITDIPKLVKNERSLSVFINYVKAIANSLPLESNPALIRIFTSPLLNKNEGGNLDPKTIYGKQVIFATNEDFIILLIYKTGNRDNCLPPSKFEFEDLLEEDLDEDDQDNVEHS